jgi:membrane protease YdiL (CAAX protease family)
MKSKRPLFIAIGYLPVLIVSAGILYWILRSSLKMILALTTLPANSQEFALTGLTHLSSPLLVIGVTYAYLYIADKSHLRNLGFGWQRRSIILLGTGLIVSMSAVALTFVVSTWSGKMVVYGLAHPTAWAILASVGIATQAGWVEELVCRGVILQKLEEGLNRPVAILLSTVLFILPHSEIYSLKLEISIVRLLTLTLVSLTLTFAYYLASRQLWLPIGLHWGIDLMTFLLIGSNAQRQGALLNWWLVGSWTIGGVRYFEWLLLGSLALIWLFLGGWWLHKFKTRQPAD